MKLQKRLLDTLFTNSMQDFFHVLSKHLDHSSSTPYTLWQVENSICEAVAGVHKGAEGRYDLYDFGYDGGKVCTKERTLEFFDEKIEVKSSVFFKYMNNVHGIVTFHTEPDNAVLEMETYNEYLGQRMNEIISRERNINVYIDYQKKLEFVKQSSRILKAVEVDEVMAVALNFFMDAFSAEAGCTIHDSEFQGFGVEFQDFENKIRVSGKSLMEVTASMEATEFIDSFIECDKFNIDNIFFIYEETMDIRIVLFNIHFDIIPDKEFSELVSSIVTTSVENAQYHKRMTEIKVQESEMQVTGDILNKFVQRNLELKSGIKISGINYPARAAGGDFLMVKETDQGIFFTVADVCGKGYSAAVFTVVLSVFTENTTLFDQEGSLKNLVTALNRYLLAKKFSDRFITAFFGYIDNDAKNMRYISCGHEPAAVFSEGKDLIIKSDFLPIGLFEEQHFEKSIELNQGDTIFIYTDGLVEYTTDDQLREDVKQLAKFGGDNILDTLYDEMVKEKSAQKDDFTCMIIRI
ncbi:protein serine/threonine phosphatase [Denitrovibrio acetiphilus DSM 12809]|uniref:Protein serine/threonine phosphatase n=1 Tax=Denitrovibrio acetiphilus (strain DSM 12809 / NBRC 114555 / N2460) TaxID=522772 RepID=D4H5L9_DENA2|nr:PP2C family protein-serine/threonine phosphatase [Denitrovibrio acetiphilus]ADD69460.1 protein serine/threonine phosphatase [Denitrovibrio acetiphilus DSM 12809]